MPSPVFFWLRLVAAAAAAASAANAVVPDFMEQQQCGNGVCGWHNEECGLYMAESTIPGAGWGVFTAVDRKAGSDDAGDDDDEYVEPFDVSIPFPDYDYQMEFDDKFKTMPEWLLKDYHWTGVQTQMLFDADQVYSITPGLGMLANSHTALYNLRNDGCLDRQRGPRNNASAGSFSHCHDQGFALLTDLPAGSELFVEYGEEWFTEREKEIGPVPLYRDFYKVDHLVRRWESLTGDAKSELAADVWEMLVVPFHPLMNERIQAALPLTHEDALRTLTDRFGSASTSMPDRSRSPQYLREHGLCLDHIETKASQFVPDQHGAFANHNLKKGQIVAPVPLVQVSRKHLEYQTADYDGGEVWWKGNQLLVNYCFGHPSSSMLLFPYSPGVNLINHAGGSVTKTDRGGKLPSPNVELRWSNRMKQELLIESVDQLLKKDKASGLLMELVALRDIQEGEELLLDYGSDFESAYLKHVQSWEPPVHADDFKSSWDYEVDDEIFTVDEIDKHPPSYIRSRCWVHHENLASEDDEGWYDWVKNEVLLLDNTLPCTVVEAVYNDDGEKESFRVVAMQEVKKGDDSEPTRRKETAKEFKKLKLKNVPWDAITFTENPYVGNQYLRRSFRHEIGLPDDIFPEAWKDLRSDKCGLYMAESAIPNSGMGMYTAQPIKNFDRIFSGDVVVQVEDYEENNRLRRIYHNESGSGEDEKWLLNSYYWNPEITMAVYEANSVQSIVPGLGMLANSHPGLVNAEVQPPILEQTGGLHRSKDPGAGAMTNYHDVHYYAPHDIEAGEEVRFRHPVCSLTYAFGFLVLFLTVALFIISRSSSLNTVTGKIDFR